MSRGTHDDGPSSPTSWPTDPSARSALADWAAGGPEAHLYATETDFGGADLSHVAFFHFYGPGCRFRDTILRGTEFSGGFLPDSDFTGADLREAEFAKAELMNSVFDRADMTRANLMGVQMEDASFIDSVLQDTAIGGTIRRCAFVRTNLRRAHFVAPDAREAVFVGADLDGSWGEMIGPVRVSVGSIAVDLSGREAESWFQGQGADVTVLTVD